MFAAGRGRKLGDGFAAGIDQRQRVVRLMDDDLCRWRQFAAGRDVGHDDFLAGAAKIFAGVESGE